MATLIRTAKSASDWSSGELDAYNIRVRRVDAVSFFGHEPWALPANAEEFRTAIDRAQVQDEETFVLLRLLSAVTDPLGGYESTVDLFALELMRLVGYTSRTRMALSRVPLDLLICGEVRSAQADVCLFDDDMIALLVQEDKRASFGRTAEPQLVAEAIAAFRENNLKRTGELGLPELEHAVMPGIVMIGTYPTFYKVRVTAELVRCVMAGTFPEHATQVESCAPLGGRRRRSGALTMANLECREASLKYLEAFKQFIGG